MEGVKSNCEMCEYYIYDDEYDNYYCEMDLDEDEMFDFVTSSSSIGNCHYFRYKNEYRSVNRQI